MKVVIAGGGTGGHVFPGIAVAEELFRLDKDVNILFVGSRRGLEAVAVPEAGFRIRFLMARGFARRQYWRWPAAAFTNAIGCLQALWIIGTERPDVVLGTGGYVSAPVAVAAWLLRRPLLLQEQNSIPGLANRVLSRVADEVHLSFVEARTYFARKDHLKVTGNPIRAHVLSGDKQQAFKEFGLEPGHPTIFVFGGSRGAHRINEAALEAMKKLKGRVDVQWILQTGREDLDWATKIVAENQLPARVMAFLSKIHLAYAAADLVVCRSGAMTLAEISACGTPSILVPYPFAAHNHQVVNASNLVDRHAAALILDEDLTGEKLAREIAHFLSDRTLLSQMSANARRFARPDAAEKLARSIMRWSLGRAALRAQALEQSQSGEGYL